MWRINVPRTIFVNYITYLKTISEGVDLNKNHNLHETVPLVRQTKTLDEVREVVLLGERVKELKSKLAKKYRHEHQLRERIAFLEGQILESQSGNVSDSQPAPGTVEKESSSFSKEQITSFADQDAGWTTEKVGMYEPTMDLANNSDSNLGNFLSRPIRESAQSWVVGQPFYYKFNPWQKFCENEFVRDKIKNFELIRMKLHVKTVISGTKFHYGRALVSYNPLTFGDQITVQRAFINQDWIQASQKPHFFLNPTKNTGGELCLPFFYPDNYLSISEGDWDFMGDITISSVQNLLHANGGDDPVTVTTYIWAEDVVLTIPTTSDPPLPSQSGRRGSRMSQADSKNSINGKDEYGQGIISKPASAVAKTAGLLSKLPIIGPYMRATEIGANATSSIAQMFGYSRPNIVSDIIQTKPSPTGNLANVDAGDGAMKLTLDSKAEITVDSRTAGLDGSDEMGILDYVKRESYLTNFDWVPGTATDELLWNTRVLPMQLDNVNVSGNGEIHMTPLAHMATAFEAWQGSIKFRFQIVKSDFHKGRILARWDPNGFTSGAVEYNTTYSRVIDIAETDDFEIVIGWGQKEPWKRCGTPYDTGSNFSDSQRLITAPEIEDQYNGVLELVVLNDLVCPSVDSPIHINVFVSACDDFKLAAPHNGAMNDLHVFKPSGDTLSTDVVERRLAKAAGILEEVLESQSSSPNVETGNSTMSDKPTSSGEMETIAKKSDQEDATYLVYYGDPPCSIRELCKRYTLTRYWYPTDIGNDELRIITLRQKNMPYYSGWDTFGIDTAFGPFNTPLTICPTAFSSWFTPAYAGVRGAFRKKYMFNTSGSQQAPLVTRERTSSLNIGKLQYRPYQFASGTDAISKALNCRVNNSTGNGTASTNLGINNTIEVELPYYYPHRFSHARTVSASLMDCNTHTVNFTDSQSETYHDPPFRNWVNFTQHDAVGEDFSLLFFTGVPVYYKYELNESSVPP